MRVPQRFWAVLLFAAISVLALVFSGLLDWITSVLFLVLEVLTDVLKPLFAQHQKPRHRAAARSRSLSGTWVHGVDRPRRPAHRKGLPWQRRAGLGAEDPPTEPEPPTPRIKVLLPLTADRPGLLAFALRECQVRHAELLVLFLQPLAVTPMGSNPLPSLEENEQARALLERIEEEAQEAGVPVRTRYEVTHDLSATILEVAVASEADLLLMEAIRRNLLWRALMGDVIQDVLMHLPERVSLLIHASFDPVGRPEWSLRPSA